MNKIKNMIKQFFDNVPSLDLNSDQETELIEQIAQKISRWDMEFPALLIGSGITPVSTILAYTTLVPFAPILEMVGIQGYDYAGLFSKKQNIQRLLERIEELMHSKEK